MGESDNTVIQNTREPDFANQRPVHIQTSLPDIVRIWSLVSFETKVANERMQMDSGERASERALDR